MPRPRRRTVPAAAGATILVALALTACTPPAPSPSQSAAPSVSASEGTPTATTAPPAVLVPAGSAADNLPFFAQIVAQVHGGQDASSGRAYIDALVAGGFDKSQMQVTADETTIGNPAESLEFSVRWGDECLVGQVGPSIGDPVTAVLPGLSSGGCLIGQTRTIDW